MNDDSKTTAPLTVVAQNDAQALARAQQAQAHEALAMALRAATRALTANMLRVIAGAGAAHDFGDQLSKLVIAFDAIQEARTADRSATLSPLTVMADALRDLDWRKGRPEYIQPSAADLARWETDDSRAVEHAEDAIVIAALRLRAAQLSAQPTQESAAHSGLQAAIQRRQVALKTRADTMTETAENPWNKEPPFVLSSPSSHGKLPLPKVSMWDALDAQRNKDDPR